MRINLKYIITFIITSLFAILTWSLVTLVDIKSKTAGVEINDVKRAARKYLNKNYTLVVIEQK